MAVGVFSWAGVGVLSTVYVHTGVHELPWAGKRSVLCDRRLDLAQHEPSEYMYSHSTDPAV